MIDSSTHIPEITTQSALFVHLENRHQMYREIKDALQFTLVQWQDLETRYFAATLNESAITPNP